MHVHRARIYKVDRVKGGIGYGLTSIALESSETYSIAVLMSYNPLHKTIAQLAYSIKYHDGMTV